MTECSSSLSKLHQGKHAIQGEVQGMQTSLIALPCCHLVSVQVSLRSCLSSPVTKAYRSIRRKQVFSASGVLLVDGTNLACKAATSRGPGGSLSDRFKQQLLTLQTEVQAEDCILLFDPPGNVRGMTLVYIHLKHAAGFALVKRIS